MAIDFPIGTRLTVCGKTLEVAADSSRFSCDACAVRTENVPEVLLNMKGVLVADHSLASGLCKCLLCVAGGREDGTGVHWKLINE